VGENVSDRDAVPANGEAPESAAWKSIKKGAAWGSIPGYLAAKAIISANSIETPFGSIYSGNVFFVFMLWIGLGAGIGAAIGWLNSQKIGDDDDVPPPSLPEQPFG
jgi:hypothetical protein